ncbi:MAG: hypothetical protein ACRD01_01970 [Terriglobales bacterium]
MTDALRSAYDFSGGARGRHHAEYSKGTNVVFLDSDLVQAFPDSPSVNRALRLLLELSKKQARRSRVDSTARRG